MYTVEQRSLAGRIGRAVQLHDPDSPAVPGYGANSPATVPATRLSTRWPR